MDRISLDLSGHRSKLNKHLFDYIEYCGLDVLTFIKEYLSNLQPYMIERNKKQEKVDSLICVIDNLYRVSVYIKINSKQFEEIIVSFHENNKNGISRQNNLIMNNTNEFVPIFADSILSICNDTYVVKVISQRGLKVLPIELPARKFKDIFIVRQSSINLQFLDYCNTYIRDLYTSDLDLNFDEIEVFTVLQQISFTSYGRDSFSSISLLIDSLIIQNDIYSKSVADMALITFTQNIKITKEQKEELVYLLETRYKVSSVKRIDEILYRIKDNLIEID